MLVNLKNLVQDLGGRKSFEYSALFPDYQLFDYFPFESPIGVKAVFNNDLGEIFLFIEISATILLRCDRCLEDFKKDIFLNLEHTLSNSPKHYDLVFLDNFKVNLDDVVLSDILLYMASKNVCDDGCRGLCFKCGCNLNVGECSCF